MTCTGKTIDLGTHKLRVVLADVESKYTIILEAGGGQSADAYQRIQDMGLVLIDPMNVKFVDRFGLENLNAVTPYFENPRENYEKAGNRMVRAAAESFAALRGQELPAQIPVTLITSGNPPFGGGVWRQCHEEMVMHSARHRLLVAEGNNHDILGENPELVVKTIVELVSLVKGDQG